MTTMLLQKLLVAIVILTTLYCTFIFLAYRDLNRKISMSLIHIIPGILFFVVGLMLNYGLRRPDLVFKHLLFIKSGFVKGILGTTALPFVAISIRVMATVASLGSLIDKFFFYWRHKRILYLIRLMPIIYMAVIAGNNLFAIIFIADHAQITKAANKLYTINAWISFWGGAALTLLIIFSVPYFFKLNRDGSHD